MRVVPVGTETRLMVWGAGFSHALHAQLIVCNHPRGLSMDRWPWKAARVPLTLAGPHVACFEGILIRGLAAWSSIIICEPMLVRKK